MSPSPTPPLAVPARLARVLGGEDRVRELAGLAAEYVQRWGLEDARAVQPGGRHSLVVLARRGADGADVALKLDPAAGGGAEAAALRLWDGRGAVRLLECGDRPGVLLLERLRPAVSLRSLAEDKAMLEAAEVLRRLWVQPPAGADGFPRLAEATAGAAEALRAAPPAVAGAETGDLVAAALAEREELLADAPGEQLLHGAFRQGRVLGGERLPWAAVSPRPAVGERAYDLALLVRDRLETLLAEPSPEGAVRRRLYRLADSMEVDRARLRGWARFRALADAGRVGPAEAELLLEFAAHL